jgi:hypothetical protein
MRNSLGVLVPTLAVTLVSVLQLFGPMWAQEAGGSVAGPSPEAGNFLFQGGSPWGMLARTQTTPTTIAESPNWTSLPNASLSWTVPPGQTALFEVFFSAVCAINNRSQQDVVGIRVLENGVEMEPADGSQHFCSIPATYTGQWSKRVSAGAHTVTVQLRVVDLGPQGNISATIDDWTLKLGVHQ